MTFCLTLFAWFLFFVVVVVLLFVCCLLLLLFFWGAHSWNQLLGLNNQEQHSKVVRYSPDSLVSVLFFNTYMPKSLGSLCVAIKIMQEILRVSKKGGLNVNTLNPSVGPTDTLCSPARSDEASATPLLPNWKRGGRHLPRKSQSIGSCLHSAKWQNLSLLPWRGHNESLLSNTWRAEPEWVRGALWGHPINVRSSIHRCRRYEPEVATLAGDVILPLAASWWPHY